MNKLEEQIQQEIQEVCPEVIEHILNEEFPVKSTGSFAQKAIDYYQIKLPKLASGKYSLTKKNIETIPGIIGSFLRQEGELPKDDIVKIQKQAIGAKYVFNIQSNRHLNKLFFDFLDEEPLDFTPSGATKVDNKTLKALSDTYNFAKLLIRHKGLLKAKSTYVDRFLDEHEDGIWYPQFQQHRTTSGRYSSDAQQMPRKKDDESGIDPEVLEEINLIRSYIICRDNFKFLDSDYESLEPRIFSHLAADQDLIDIFYNGEDFYSKIAIKALSLQNVSAIKTDPNFLKKINPNARQDSKAYSLGIAYGLKSFKLSTMLKITPDEAQKIIDDYLQAFPKLKNNMDRLHSSAKHFGYVKSQFGRIRHLPEVKTIYRQYGDQILNPIWAAKRGLKDVRKKYNNELNNALNFPIQSAAASVVNRSAIRMAKWFAEENIEAHIVANVHDQMIVECSEKDLDRAKYIMQECMENTVKLLVPLPAKPEVARNWADGH